MNTGRCRGSGQAYGDHIIEIHLDDYAHAYLRDPATCYSYVRSMTQGEGRYYVLLDEVQLMSDFVDVINGLIRLEELDVYITGSNLTCTGWRILS